MNAQNVRPPVVRSRTRWAVGLAAILVIIFSVAWLVEEMVVRRVAPGVAEWMGGPAGCEIRVASASGRFTRQVVLHEVRITCGEGTDLAVQRLVVGLAGPRDWWQGRRRGLARVALEGVRGEVAVGGVAPAEGVTAPHAARGAWFTSWPAVLEVRDARVRWVASGWAVEVSDASVVLDENRTGTLQVGQVRAELGGWRQGFDDISAITAWRNGTAYLSDATLGPDVTIDELSWHLGSRRALTLQARAFDGYLYADWTRPPAQDTKASLNAFQLALPGLAAFLGRDEAVAGQIDVAKLTFHGDPARPWSAQMSLRLEARDFAWEERAFEELTLGLSVAGRRVRINEGVLRQAQNRVNLRGTVTLPLERAGAAWREAPFDFDLAAEVRDLRALGELAGPPWNELSGGLSAEGRGTGQAADGEGWLKVRGWDLRARGVPGSSVQADLALQGRDLQLTSLDVQSGKDFARGFGRLSLNESLTYNGRFEMRVREVARYLEPLGRFAPDWAREGGVLLFWDGDGTATSHSGVATMELVKFTGDLNPVPVNAKLSATYSPGNVYVSRFLLDRGPLSLSSTFYFGAEGLSVQGIQLFSGRTRLLQGELFLPLSLEAVLARRPWEETVRPEGGLYALLRSDDLELASVAALFGQETTLRGRVDLQLDARGPWRTATMEGRLNVAGLRAEFPDWKIPEARAAMNFQLADRTAEVSASLEPRGREAITLEAKVPVFGSPPEGGWTLLDTAAPWEGRLHIPPTDVADFSPRAAGVRWSAGLLSGEVQGSGTLAQPHWDGHLEWTDGRVEFPGDWLPAGQVEARIVLASTRAVLEEGLFRMGEGSGHLTGEADLAGTAGGTLWAWSLRGEGLALLENEHARLVGSPDLQGQGDRTSGRISGRVDLEGSEGRGNLAIVPVLGAAASPVGMIPLPGLVHPPDAWTLDIALGAREPLAAVSGGGLLTPELFLVGTVGQPLLLGTLGVENLPVALPADRVLLARGAVHFTRERPWEPILDLTATGEAGPYDVRAGAFGPLGDRRLFVSSTPPLASEQIVLMLATGVAPVSTAAARSLSPEERLAAEPAWFDLGRIRGLFGWSTDADGSDGEEFRLGEEVVGFEWEWRK